MRITKGEKLNNLPKDIQKIYTEIDKEILNLNVEWRLYRSLFMENSSITELLNVTAIDFFFTLKLCLIDSILLKLFRLLEPPESCGQANCNIRYLVDFLNNNRLKGCRTKLNKYRKRLVNIYDRYLQKYRNKAFAHKNKDYSLNRTKVKIPTLNKVSKAIRYTNEIMREFCKYYRGADISYFDIGGPREADQIIRHLIRSKEINELYKNGIIHSNYLFTNNKFKYLL